MQWTAATCADGHTADNVARDLQIDPKYAEAIEREYAYGSTVMQECRWELADAQGIRKRKIAQEANNIYAWCRRTDSKRRSSDEDRQRG